MLIIMRGISGSGKSSVLANNVDPSMIVSSEHYRKLLAGDEACQSISREVFQLMESIVETRLTNGLPTVIDATCLKLSSINKFLAIADKLKIKPHVISFDVDVEVCIERVNRRASRGGLMVPEEVIRRQYTNLLNSYGGFINKFGDQFHVVNEDTVEDVLIRIINTLACTFYDVTDDKGFWCLGDIHACPDELNDIIKLIRNKDLDAKIYALGDVIDRGPSLLNTVLALYWGGVEVIQGNHEYNFIKESAGMMECRSRAREATHSMYAAMIPRHQKVADLKLYNNAHFKMIIHETTGQMYVLSHAGLKWDAVHSSFIPAIEAVRGVDEYGEKPHHVVRQVHGHKSWEYTDIAETCNDEVVNIDGGLYKGGCLVAYNPVTCEYIKVQAKKVYFDHE